MSTDADGRLAYGADIEPRVAWHIDRYYEDNSGERVEIETKYGTRSKQPEPYCVYVLECEPIDHTAYGTDEYLIENWRLWTEDIPYYNEHEPAKWAWAAYYAENVYYVGQTNNIHERLRDHSEDPEKGSIFCMLFPPLHVNDLHWFKTRAQAEQAEERISDRVEDTYHDAFVFHA